MPSLNLWIPAAILGASLFADAQWLNYPTPGIPRTADGKPNLMAPAPHTPDGKPDFSGLWNKISKYRANIAMDVDPADMQPWVKPLVQQRIEDLSKDHMSARCLPLGPGYTTDADSNGGGMMKIVQTPALILILNQDLTYRQVFMDGRALEANPAQPSWMGYSIGRWEGDTLVVESSGFNDRTWLDYNGHPHTEGLRTTERYRRPNFGHLEVSMTLQDSAIYAKPWTVTVTAELAADTEVLEYVCGDNDKGREHWVGKASDETRSEVKVAPEILAKYVGTYVEQPKYWRFKARTAVFTFSDGALVGQMDGKEKERQIARSETTFSGFGGLAIEFIRDAQGEPTGLIVKHVSGDYKFARQK
jgi:hypothetical protein